MSLITKNIVVVGDGAVGKTCLLHSYTSQGEFRQSYIPTIYEKDVIELEMDNQRHLIKLHDTAGQEEFERLRQVIYKEADCFILCFSIGDRTSFENITSKWYRELQPLQIPIILVGTKSDLQNTPSHIVSTTEGEIIKRKINANSFIECSAKDYININEVIYEAIRATTNGIPEIEEEQQSCCNCC